MVWMFVVEKRQFAYTVTFRRIRVTIVAVEKR